MGTDYAEYLIPVRPHHGYIPSAPVTEALLHGLAEQKWVDPASQLVRVHAGSGKSETQAFPVAVKEVSALVVAPSGVMATFPALPSESWWPKGAVDASGRSRMYEVEEVDELLPKYCEAVTLVVTTKPLMVPADGRTVRCPRCKVPQWGEMDEYGVGIVLPAACAECGAVLLPETLLAVTHNPIDGAPTEEPAPYFRFALVLETAPKASPGAFPLRVDPKLRDLCFRTTGHQFRSVAQWG